MCFRVCVCVELRVGEGLLARVSLKKKRGGGGRATIYKQFLADSPVMDGRISAAGRRLHICLQVDSEVQQEPRETGLGRDECGEAGAFSAPRRAPAQCALQHGGGARRPILISHSAGRHGGFAAAVPALW